MSDGENYKGARTFANIEHLGVPFRIVRRRFGDKAGTGPMWGKYWQLLHEDVPMSTSKFVEGTLQDAVREYSETLRRVYPDTAPARESMVDQIRVCIEKHKAAMAERAREYASVAGWRS